VDGEVAITVRGLVKSFGEVRALGGVDLDVATGTVLGLLGPNGAGKTTLVRVLTTLLAPDAGTATVVGLDVIKDAAKLRHRIGLAGQYAAVDENLTGLENLTMVGRLYGASRRQAKGRGRELLERFQLSDAGDRAASTYSGGMRRRLDLAMTLVGSPRVIFLDEPTTGLDPRGRHTMWDAIHRLAADRVTIFLTTQYLEEADQLADRIAVLDRGRVVAEGTPAELKRRIPGGHIELEFATGDELEVAERALDDATREGEELLLRVPNDGSVGALRGLLERLDDAGAAIAQLSMHTPDLDDVFFAVTGHLAAEEPTAI
jgi:ABC-2 type transport system ATP-binding protein